MSANDFMAMLENPNEVSDYNDGQEMSIQSDKKTRNSNDKGKKIKFQNKENIIVKQDEIELQNIERKNEAVTFINKITFSEKLGPFNQKKLENCKRIKVIHIETSL